MVLNPTRQIESPQEATGRISKAIVKQIPSKLGGSMSIVELTIGEITGNLRGIIGTGTLRVGLACDSFNLKTKLGELAYSLNVWDGKSSFDEHDLEGELVSFRCFLQESNGGPYWQIDRQSIRPK